MKETILKDFIIAYKAGDIIKKATLAILKSKISEFETSPTNVGKQITDQDILTIIGSEIKKRQQAIELYKKEGSEKGLDNAEREEKEILVLKEYLPKQMTETEIRKQIETLKSLMGSEQKLVPYVMQYFNKHFKGSFDNKQLQELLKQY